MGLFKLALTVFESNEDIIFEELSELVGPNPACSDCHGTGEVPQTMNEPPHYCDCDREERVDELYKELLHFKINELEKKGGKNERK